MAKAQTELEGKTVEVAAAGGKIKVTANGAGEILSIKIDQQIVDPSDVEFWRKPSSPACSRRLTRQSARAIRDEKITGGLGMPGL